MFISLCVTSRYIRTASVLLCVDYPYCLAGKELRAVIRNLLSKCSDALPELFDHCVFTMLREQEQPGESRSRPCVAPLRSELCVLSSAVSAAPAGQSLHGYRMSIQALMQNKPQIVTLNLADVSHTLSSHSCSRPP